MVKDRARVLVVEDDAILATHLEQTLDQMGYLPVGLAATGKDAVKEAASLQPDVILMDIRLRGEMTGIQAAEAIRSRQDIPVIYLTAYSDDPLIQQAKLTEPYAYLAKPVRDRELRASIEMALYKHESERRVARLNQVLRAVRDVNQLITREKDPQPLLDQACQILVQTRGYQLVWIGKQEAGQARLRVLASDGTGNRVLKIIASSGTDEEAGNLPCIAAWRTRETVLAQDVLQDERYAPWREALRKQKFGSCAALPMLHEGELSGVLCVHADRASAFDEEEVGLLNELAGDLAFALYSIRQEEARRSAEETLSRTEHIYRRAITQAGGVPYQRLFSSDAFAFLGEGIEDLTGYTVDEMTGTLFTSRLRQTQSYGEHKDLEHSERVRLARQGTITEWREDYLFERKDGRLVWLADHSVPVHDASRKTIGSLGILMDITERKHAEEALRESEERYRTVADHTYNWEYWIGPDGQWLYCSPSCERITGYPAEKFLQDPALLNEIVHPEDRESFVRHRGRESDSDNIDFRILTRRGEVRWIGHFCQEIVTPEGRRLGRRASNRDITARKQAEAQLGLQSAALEAAANAILITDREGIILWANRAFTALTGYTVEETVGRNPRDLLKSGKQDGAAYKELWDTILAGQVWHGELVNRRKDGSLYFEEMTITPLPEESGQNRHFIAVKQDISERRQAEETLRESEARFRTIFEQAAVGVAQVVSRTGKYIKVNQKHCDILGYTSAELLQMNFQDVTHPDDLQPDLDLMGQLLDGKIPSFSMEKRFIHKDGATVWGYLTVSPMWERGEEPTTHIAVVEDITSKKQAEEAVRDSEERYRLLFELSPDAIAVYQDGKIVFANQAAAKLLGTARVDDLIGRPVLDFVHPDFHGLVVERARLQVESGQTVPSVDERFIRLDGSEVDVEVVAAPIRYREALAFLVIARDITERKRGEQELRASEERYRMLAENMSDTVWLMDMSLKTTYISPSVTRLRGYTLEELNAVPLDRQMTADSLQRAFELFGEALSPGNPANTDEPFSKTIELEFYKKDGTRFWSESTFTLIRDPNNVPVAILGSGRDITERKRAEQELRESEEKFRGVVQQSADGIVLTDEQGTVIEWNHGEEEISGVLRRNALGRKTWDVMFDVTVPENKSPDRYRQLRSGLQQALITGRSPFLDQVREDLLIRPDGERRVVQALTFVIPSNRGFRSCSISRDVTEKKKADETLRRRVAELEVLYENGLIISRLLDRREIARKMIELLASKLSWHHAAIRLYHPEIDRVELLALSNPGMTEEELQEQIERLNRVIARPGKGLSGWVIKHGQPIRCPDVQSDKRYVSTYEDIRSGVYVPIQMGESIIGSIAVESEQLDAFSEEDERLLKTLAAQSAIAFENARHYQEVVRASDRRTILHRASREIVVAGLDLEAVFAAIFQAATELMKADVFTIALYDQSARRIDAVFLMDGGERFPNMQVPLGKGISGWVIEKRRSMRLIDYLKERPNDSVPFGKRRTSRSVLAVPMVAGTNIVGAISVQAYRPGEYNEEDEVLLEMLAAYAGAAIENARLFDETQKRLRNLSALHAIDTAIGASVDLNITLSILLEHAAAELKIDAAAVLVFNPATRALEYSATHGFRTHLAEGTRLKLGEGLAGQAAVRRELQGVADLGAAGLAPEDLKPMTRVYEQEKFVAHYAIPLVAKGQIQGVLEAFHRSSFQPDDDWMRFFDLLAGQAAIAIDSVRLFEDLQRSNLNLTFAYDATIQGWSQALELRDKDTEGHTQRVTNLTVRLAQSMGVPLSEMEHVRRGALLHDIGKMATPDAILLKPDTLTDDEWAIMRQHPVHAFEMLSEIAYLRPALSIPHHHHEKWDGSGYPDGLKGDQIPLPARIFAVVDVWDALTSDRPYRSAWSEEEAMVYIKVQAGKHFDPNVVDAFFALREMEASLGEDAGGLEMKP